MKRRWYLIGAFALTAIFAFVTIRLFDQDFAEGETYPENSSLRADPKGAKLLYDSLSRVPGLKVSRNFQPVNAIKPRGETLVFLSCNMSDPGLDVLESLAGQGNRLLISLPNAFETEAPERWVLRHWGLRFTPVKKGPDLAKAGVKSPIDLTVTTWTLSAAIGWTVIDRDESALIAVEKAFGKGSIVLLHEQPGFHQHGYARPGCGRSRAHRDRSRLEHRDRLRRIASGRHRIGQRRRARPAVPPHRPRYRLRDSGRALHLAQYQFVSARARTSGRRSGPFRFARPRSAAAPPRPRLESRRQLLARVDRLQPPRIPRSEDQARRSGRRGVIR